MYTLHDNIIIFQYISSVNIIIILFVTTSENQIVYIKKRTYTTHIYNYIYIYIYIYIYYIIIDYNN